MKEYGRGLRVADHLREELAGIIGREMRDPRVSMVTVNDVRVSRDLAVADVYISSLQADTDEAKTDLMSALQGAAGFLRSAVARQNTMRTTPRLRFHYDELIEDAIRMDQLIDQAVRSDRQEPFEDG
jgi:ribosome-binding factor A